MIKIHSHRDSKSPAGGGNCRPSPIILRTKSLSSHADYSMRAGVKIGISVKPVIWESGDGGEKIFLKKVKKMNFLGKIAPV